jgi:hypothetical protein
MEATQIAHKISQAEGWLAYGAVHTTAGFRDKSESEQVAIFKATGPYGCGWMRPCVNDATKLTLHATLGPVGVCDECAHELNLVTYS